VLVLDSRPMGAAWVADRLWERLGIGKAIISTLERRPGRGRHLDAALVGTIMPPQTTRATIPGAAAAARQPPDCPTGSRLGPNAQVSRNIRQPVDGGQIRSHLGDPAVRSAHAGLINAVQLGSVPGSCSRRRRRRCSVSRCQTRQATPSLIGDIAMTADARRSERPCTSDEATLAWAQLRNVT
jgi:hypothetical protein